jgi:hypothetical protein
MSRDKQQNKKRVVILVRVDHGDLCLIMAVYGGKNVRKTSRSDIKSNDQYCCQTYLVFSPTSMSNSYGVPPGQQWNPNFNFPHLQLENDFDYNNLSVQGSQRQQQQQQQQHLQHQQDQLNYTAQQYTQTPTPPHSSSSLHGAFTMPTNQQLPTQSSPPQYSNGIQHDYVSNSYANQQQQRSAAHVPASNSYLPNSFNFSSPPRAASSTMNLDPVQTSNASTFLAPQGSETQQQQSYYLPPSTSKESILPQAKRPRSVTYNDELNPEDADLDSEPGPSDQKDSANRPKL